MHRPRKEQLQNIVTVFAKAMQNDPLHAEFFSKEHRFVCNKILYEYIVHTEWDDVVISSPRCEGVAIWKPPGVVSSISQDISMHTVAAVRLVHGLGLKAIARLVRHHRWTMRLRREIHPETHWYLRVIAVDPAFQKKGIGGALLRPLLAQAEESGLSVYLETQNPANIPIYEHFGFHRLRSERIPGSDLIHTSMVRRGPSYTTSPQS
jgi:ribosomal protein S18 acetylase RimI-like enzyme